MKIAIISDIHGNLEALKATLDDIKKRNIDKIYCIGDIIAKGTHQQECYDLVKEKCEVIIKGNCDEHFVKVLDPNEMPNSEALRYNWINSKIDEKTKEEIRKLPFSYEFYLSGRLVRLLHAHPESTYKFVGNIDYLDNLYSLVLPSDNTISNEKADILVYGHIHTPFIQKIYNRYIINTGSVGNSIDVFRNDTKDGALMNTTVANYLILDGNLDSKDVNDSISFEIVNVSYDILKELKANDDNIEYDSYAVELKNGVYRDMEKIYKSFEARGIDKDSI